MKKENVSLLACPLQHSIDSLLDGAEVYYLGDYFQSFSFCPCARGSARHYTGTDWVSCGHRFGLNADVDIGLSVDNGHHLTLTHCHSSGLHPVLTSALSQMLLLSCVHLLTLLLPFGSFFNKQHSLEVKSFHITVHKEEKAVSVKKN